ncbi:MAG: hypothetical protein N2109_13535, partial [Fimbriimonadales bacterium]|nr:hypothetical protein [Fimbriimonadales bacterium]
MTEKSLAWRRFGAAAGSLVVLQYVADRARVPEAWSAPLGVVVGAAVLGLSVFGLFLGAAADPARRWSTVALLAGVVWMAAMTVLSRSLPQGGVGWASLLLALGQAAEVLVEQVVDIAEGEALFGQKIGQETRVK